MTLPKITVHRGYPSEIQAISTAYTVAVDGYVGPVTRAPDRELHRRYSRLLTTRHVVALVAAHSGRVRARRRRRHSWGHTDEWLQAECDDYGIGPHTLAEMQREAPDHAALLTSPEKPAPVRLTPYGKAVLKGLAALPGFTLER